MVWKVRCPECRGRGIYDVQRPEKNEKPQVQKFFLLMMDFAEEKTKTWDDHEAKWSMGKKEDKIRFLGYFIIKPHPTQRTQEEDWSAHVSRWQTKGNLVFNIIRAMTQRTERGIKTISALRLLYTCTRMMLHYGVEFWGGNDKQAKTTNAYMYEALRRLFDIPIATPHRALSSEFALPPTKIQWEYVRTRLGERRRRHDATRRIGWKEMEIESKGTGSTLPWKVKFTNKPGHMNEGKTREWEEVEEIEEGEIAIFTDGLLKEGKVGYGIAAYTKKSIKEGKTEWEEAASMEGKGIMDAETWAMIRAIHITNGRAKKIMIFTDSRNAKDWILGAKKEGHMAYMWEELCEATKDKGTEIEISWVKGHAGNKGNERADALARKGGEKIDPWEGKSHAASAHEISEERIKAWKNWFNEKEHYHKRQPRRKLKHLKGLTRADVTAVFRIQSDKGWEKR